MDNGIEIERRFVAAIEKLLEQSKSRVDAKEMCEAVWPPSKPGQKVDQVWQRLKSKSKPQRLTIGDAYRLAHFFGYNFPDMIWRITKEIQESESGEKLGRRWTDPKKAARGNR